MPQIQKGETFADGQQVTGARLNQLIDSATILPNIITDQTNLTANTVASGDSVLLYDLSATALREATASDLLNSNIAITTSSITGGTGVDITVTPASTYKFDVNGAFEANSINSVGNVTIGGTAVVTGALTASSTLGVTGATTLTGNVIVDNGLTSNGIANFTGTLQVNGVVGYVLTDIIEETIPTWTTAGEVVTTWTTKFTSASYTKPAGEIWVVQVDANYYYYADGSYDAHRLILTSTSQLLGAVVSIEGSGTSYVHYDNFSFTKVFQSADTFTSTFKIDVKSNNGAWMGLGNVNADFITAGLTLPASKFRILKYKTA